MRSEWHVPSSALSKGGTSKRAWKTHGMHKGAPWETMPLTWWDFMVDLIEIEALNIGYCTTSSMKMCKFCSPICQVRVSRFDQRCNSFTPSLFHASSALPPPPLWHLAQRHNVRRHNRCQKECQTCEKRIPDRRRHTAQPPKVCVFSRFVSSEQVWTMTMTSRRK